MAKPLFLFVFALLALARAAQAEPIDYDLLHSRLSRLAEEPDMAGLAVAVVENGQITFARGYGETVRGGGERVTEHTVFRWASLSKGVAATVVGQLVEEERLKWGDTLSRFSRTLRLPGAAQTEATISDLLSHRLGIVSNAYDTRLEDNRDPRDIRRALGGLRSICPVGDCHTYQNVAYDAASEVVASVTEQTYAEAVQERIFDPLGMTSASLDRAGLETAASWARPHPRNAGGRPVAVSEAYYRVPAAGGVNSSIRDLAVYMQAQMGARPYVLAPSVLEGIHAPQVRTLREQRSINRRWGRVANAQYGHGWRIYDYEGRKVVGHRGAVRGYRALILFDPDVDTGVAALWNSSSRKPVGIQFEVMDMVYGLPLRDWMTLDGGRETAPRELGG